MPRTTGDRRIAKRFAASANVDGPSLGGTLADLRPPAGAGLCAGSGPASSVAGLRFFPAASRGFR